MVDPLAAGWRMWGPWHRTVAPWDDDDPVRSEIFGPDRFEQHARTLADSQMTVRPSRPVVSILARLEQNTKVLLACYRSLMADVRDGVPITPAAEWLVDNYHQVEKHTHGARKDLPEQYFNELPKLGEGFLEGHPRIFGIVWAYVAHTDSQFDPDLLARYIRSYETRKALTLGELWAVAITLRLILIENLRRLAVRIVATSRDRRAADHIADQLLGRGEHARRIEELIPDAAHFRPSTAYAVQLLRRLREENQPEHLVWVVERIREAGQDPDVLVLEEHQRQANATVTMANIFTSLRLIGDVNWADWLESVGLIEQELRHNEGYAALDFATRNAYRSAVERLAKGAGQEEIQVARAALHHAGLGVDDRSRDLGYVLLADGSRAFESAIGYRPNPTERFIRVAKRLGIGGYLTALSVATLGLVALALYLIWRVSGPVPIPVLVALGIMAGFPFSDLALGVVNYRTAKLFHASPLPALALRDGVPDHLRTLVTMPSMLTSRESIDELVDNLEVHYLANQGGELYFALVTDWADSEIARDSTDDELLAYARDHIRRLNAAHGHRFLLLHRQRLFNPAEGVWMGWERKRGKLEELGRLLRGADDTSFLVVEGLIPGRFTYVLTLDSDTRLPREGARRLVGKMGHPLNRPVFDPVCGRVVKGHGILQPRVTPSLPDGEASSPFQRIYSTQRGLDPYAVAISDVYQDLFDEGSFAGKGIYDIDAVDEALAGKVPANALLSHDLLEGNYSRSGLVTDVEVVEEFPQAYAVSASRTHRWVRGDWQLLPWLLWRRQGLTALHVWKMVDNLRRSVVPLFLSLAFIGGLALLPVRGALVWTLCLMATFFLPPLFPVPEALANPGKGITRSSELRAITEDIRRGLVLGLTNLTLLAHQATMLVDAICRTLYRLTISRKNLLEWTTAAQAQQAAKGTVRYYWNLMRLSWVIPVAALAVAAWRGPAMLAVAIVPCALWLAGPVVAQRLSRGEELLDHQATPADLQSLRLVARRTWSFFTTFVTAAENHLPPDNFQEDPEPVVAHRTSPTNIGLYLLACVSAYDFGWIGLAELTDRLEATMGTMARLERYRGHLLNWYDTRRLEPLLPRYVSSVDSGNLAGHLLALAQACEQIADGRGSSHDGQAVGVGDALALARQAARAAGDKTPGLSADLDRIEAMLVGGANPDQIAAAVTTIAQNLGRSKDSGSEAETAYWLYAAAADLASHDRDDRLDPAARVGLDARLRSIADRARRESREMDFSFLLDKQRHLLVVGYQVADERQDASCYDLLASECRLGSFVAIAKGDLRTRHWFRLGRTVTAVGNSAALVSWSGSMFEYLMPSLVMRSPIGGLLDRTGRLIVKRQIDYATRLGIPWGISESAYNARDVHHTYQYSPFGVPGLGLVRGLADNLVVAPYATGLAAMVDPAAAAANYARLAQVGARGRYGFYEAVDYTPRRVPDGSTGVVVRCFMAHHQGMTVLALSNVLHNGVMRDRFHSEPIVQATELLLQERAPRTVPITRTRQGERETTRRALIAPAPVERVYAGNKAVAPRLHLLSNGRITMLLTGAGAGQVRWNDLSITRWHPDATAEETGDFIYLRDEVTGHVWSPTAMPHPGSLTDYEVMFTEAKATYRRRRRRITTHLDCHVSPESDAVVRRLTIHNDGRFAKELSVTTYAELALARAGDDDAHPAFSKMFVHTEFVPSHGALLATRRQRSASDPQVWVGHVIHVERGALGTPSAETDRLRFLGRGRGVRTPIMRGDGKTAGSTGFVLDPVLSLSQRVRVSAGRTVRLYIWTVVGQTRDDVLHLLDRHATRGAYERVAMLSWTESQIQLRHLGISAENAGAFQELAGHLVYPDLRLRAPEGDLTDRPTAQSGLWPMGISGDVPIVVARIDDPEDTGLVRELVAAHQFWRLKQFRSDLVILNDQATGYAQDLQYEVQNLADSITLSLAGEKGTIHVLRSDQLSAENLLAILTAAEVVLKARHGDLTTHLARVNRRPPGIARRSDATAITGRIADTRPVDADERQPMPGDLLLANGFGGFAPDGREYVVVLDAGHPTPAPWTNVVANASFGFHATAEGAGYTWWRNSRDNQLTPWRNDPVVAPVSEAFYLRDENSGVVFSPTASPIDSGRHVARHGFGYTAYEHSHDGLRTVLTLLVAGDDPVKLSWLRIHNDSESARTVTVTWYAEPVLGQVKHVTASRLVTSHDDRTGAVFIRNRWSTQFADQVVFADMTGRQESVTGNRLEFLGRLGTTSRPAAMLRSGELSGRVGPGLDPCVALRRSVTIPAGEYADVTVQFGAATDEEGARQLVLAYRNQDPEELLRTERERWDRRLDTITVNTPDSSFDLIMNGWLLYQTLACRMLARSGYYQASGAYGFRDQLQDSMAVLLVDSDAAREHLVRAAGRQFVEGDVQHWWLPATGAGIRTRISDDVVWLALCAARYATVTGDAEVFDEPIPYLSGPVLEDGQHENFFQPGTADLVETLYDHCKRALRRAFPVGRHGLPLMGTGDWNDGMNRVGQDGQGESVWLGWFLHTALGAFVPVAQLRGDHDFAAQCVSHQQRLLRGLEDAGWDGRWYRRGYFDDGTPLGSVSRGECRIDSIAQSWAVMSGSARPDRARSAMDEVVRQLLLPREGVARLFTPPFDVSQPDPGYIRAYPPGVRENGGQYTHGAVWSIFAFAALGREDTAATLFWHANPINHARTPEQANIYRVEPYVVAADIYSVAPYVGRGGWTWYTGSSGWLYRAGIEAILGLRRNAGWLIVQPCLPPEWTEASVSYRIGDTFYDIEFRASGATPRRVASIQVDDRTLVMTDRIPLLTGGGRHKVIVTLEWAGATSAREMTQ